MQRLLSGIQPSGELHLGNYLGAVKRFVQMQADYQSYIAIVDLHAITVPQDKDQLPQQIRHLANAYLACGIDPAKAVLFRQSHVSAHAELNWLLATITHMGELRRMTQFKDKSGKTEIDSVGFGLFAYPVLQAADILLYQPDVVPVGEDQKQHVEFTRDLAERFNNRFAEVFKVPEPLIPANGARIMGLDDPTKKMSKSASSAHNYIALTDSDDLIADKIKRAVTDSGSEIAAGPDRPALTNLLTIYSLLTDRAVAEIEAEYAGKGYKDFKDGLTVAVITAIAPIRERILELDKDPAATDAILEDGATRAAKTANQTLVAAKSAMGL